MGRFTCPAGVRLTPLTVVAGGVGRRALGAGWWGRVSCGLPSGRASFQTVIRARSVATVESRRAENGVGRNGRPDLGAGPAPRSARAHTAAGLRRPHTARCRGSIGRLTIIGGRRTATNRTPVGHHPPPELFDHRDPPPGSGKRGTRRPHERHANAPRKRHKSLFRRSLAGSQQ